MISGGMVIGWFTPGGDPGGPRRGRWCGDDAPFGGRTATALLTLALVLLAVLFLAVSCLA